MRTVSFLSVLSGVVISCIILMSGCSGTEDVYKENQLPNYTVSIEIINSMQDSPVIARFFPTEGAAKVEYALGKTSDLESFKSGTLEDVLTHDGDSAFSWDLNDDNELEVNEEYTVFARVLGAEGEKYPVAVQSFIFNDSDNSFLKITPHYVSDVSVGFKVECSEKIHLIKAAFGKQEDKQAFIDNTLEGIQIYEEPFMTQYCNGFDLEPGSEYVFYCKGYTLTDSQTTLYTAEFKTFSAEDMIPDVKLECDIDVFRGVYSITPNDLCDNAIFTVFRQGTQDAVIYGAYEYAGDLSTLLTECAQILFPFDAFQVDSGYIGTMEVFTAELATDIPLEVYVSIYDRNNELFSIKRYNVSTPSFDEDLGDAAVEISISDITSVGATFDFAPNDNTLLYLFEVYSKEYYEQLAEQIKSGDIYEYCIHDELFYAGFFQYMKDPIEPYTVTECEPGTDYYFVVAPMNYNGLDVGWGPLNVLPFRTLD